MTNNVIVFKTIKSSGRLKGFQRDKSVRALNQHILSLVYRIILKVYPVVFQLFNVMYGPYRLGNILFSFILEQREKSNMAVKQVVCPVVCVNAGDGGGERWKKRGIRPKNGCFKVFSLCGPTKSSERNNKILMR